MICRLGARVQGLVVSLLIAGCIESHPGWIDPEQTGGSSSETSSADEGAGETTTAPGDGSGDSSAESTTSADESTSESGMDGGGQTTGDGGSDGMTTGSGTQHRVFVSSQGYTGNLGGLPGADAKCQALADAAGLGSTWMAILSTPTAPARDRLSITEPVVDLMGRPIASDATDLWDAMIDGPIELDELGQTHAGPVWTGSRADGSADDEHCTSWTNDVGQDKGIDGTAGQSDDRWLFNGFRFCDVVLRLYCISQ